MPDHAPTGAHLGFDVGPQDLAIALGSGDVAVLATPRLLAWCEAATCAAAGASEVVPEGSTTVGSRVVLDHLLPTPVGGRVEVEARLVAVDVRVLRFDVTATDRAGRLVGSAQISRVMVDTGRFAERVPEP